MGYIEDRRTLCWTALVCTCWSVYGLRFLPAQRIDYDGGILCPPTRAKMPVDASDQLLRGKG